MRATIVFIGVMALLGVRLQAADTTLGIVEVRQEAFFDLLFQNTGKSAVRISDVKPACECITVLSHPETVAAGATARIPCVYRSAIPGNIRTTVEILGADPAQPQATLSVTGFVAEKSWLVSASDAIASSDRALIVDVRRAEEFARSHPTRALNLPLFSLKSRAALRQRKVVLIDEGFAPESLLAEVVLLRRQGFTDVSVLNGGLAAWKRAGGEVEGEMKSPIQMATISAAEFIRSRETTAWQCVEIGGQAKSDPQTVELSHVTDVRDLEEKLTAWSSPISGGLVFHPVLIVVADQQVRAQIESRLGRNAQCQLYYLDGGADTVAAFQAAQAALAHHTGQTFAAHSPNSRPLSRSVVSGGCGSCGKK